LTSIKLTDSNFQKEVIQSTQPVLVEIYADWCGTCHMMAPIIEKLTHEFKRQIKMGKLDIDTNESVARKYGVGELPILLFFKNGELIDHMIAAIPKEVITTKLNDLLRTEQ